MLHCDFRITSHSPEVRPRQISEVLMTVIKMEPRMLVCWRTSFLVLVLKMSKISKTKPLIHSAQHCCRKKREISSRLLQNWIGYRSSYLFSVLQGCEQYSIMAWLVCEKLMDFVAFSRLVRSAITRFSPTDCCLGHFRGRGRPDAQVIPSIIMGTFVDW